MFSASAEIASLRRLFDQRFSACAQRRILAPNWNARRASGPSARSEKWATIPR